MRFVADAMLGSLAKRLRLHGFDVAYDPSADDTEIIRRSLSEGRTILTRDTGLASRPLASNCLLILSDNIEEQIDQVRVTHPDQFNQQLLTRCSVCNGSLVPAPRDEVRDFVPEHVFRTKASFQRCTGCGKIYWEGTHVRRMRAKLEKTIKKGRHR